MERDLEKYKKGKLREREYQIQEKETSARKWETAKENEGLLYVQKVLTHFVQ